MSVALSMSIIYPLLAVTALVLAALLVLYYFNVRSVRAVLAGSAFLFSEFLAFAILALTTGLRPTLEFDYLRPWLVGVRWLMLVSLWWWAYEALRMIRQQTIRNAQAEEKQCKV